MRLARPALRTLVVPACLVLLASSAGCDKDGTDTTPPPPQPQDEQPMAEPTEPEESAMAQDPEQAEPEQAEQAEPEQAEPEQAEPAATAELQAAKGRKVSGTVEFLAADEGVQVRAQISGLKPGMHGFHIHEKGDCSAPDFKSAGDHFNPTKAPHAAPTDAKHHYGDMGNIEAGEDGVANVDITMPELSVEEDAEGSIIGKAIVVHQDKDDLESQPSGKAGPRVACGVIKKAGTEDRTASR